MKRSAKVSLGLVTALAATVLTGCGSDPDHEAVCMDTQTQNRMDESECERDTGGSRFIYVYYPVSSRISHPAVGEKVASGYTTVKPAGGYRVGGIPARGGFGGRGGSFVGG